MIVARPLSPAEPDLIEGYTLATLRILSLDGVEVVQYHAPQGGWTHDALECVDYFSVSSGLALLRFEFKGGEVSARREVIWILEWGVSFLLGLWIGNVGVMNSESL